MKFGVVMHKTTQNLGDDIQTYAAAKLLPRVDYVIDREYISEFQSENNEPVAVLLNAWWMWKKWNWPPADCIIPKLISMHINNYGIMRNSSPITDEWIKGCGGEYFKSYGPVGCRDGSSLEFLTKHGIESYFSGCLTLTLPGQKETPDKGTYVCLVDLPQKIKEKVIECLKDSGLEIREMTHKCDYRNSNATLEERFEKVEEVLTQYQNAKLVVTSRLHATLPCLSMEVPVFVIVDLKDEEKNCARWDRYSSMVNLHDNSEFLNNSNVDMLDCMTGWGGGGAHIPIREKLIDEVNDFVKEFKDCKLTVGQIKKTNYSLEEKFIFQNNLKSLALDKWLIESRELVKSSKQDVRDLNITKAKFEKCKKERDVYKKNADEWQNMTMPKFIKKAIKYFIRKMGVK